MDPSEIEIKTEGPATHTTNGKSPSGIGSNSGQENESTESGGKNEGDEPIVKLGKYILLLATLVATVTYAAGFNPPGGVWQETDPVARHLAGDPIIRDTQYYRYLVFFYCNATAFASSLVVIVVLLLLAILYENVVPKEAILLLQGVMVLDLVSLTGAYVAGICWDESSTVYYTVVLAGAFFYLTVQRWVLARCQDEKNNDALLDEQERDRLRKEWDRLRKELDRLRKVLMLLAMFALSITYVAGLSTPGGLWDSAEGGHRLGNPILMDHHGVRLTVFFAFNTMAFVTSLLIVVLLLDKKFREGPVRSRVLYGWIIVALIGLVCAYAAGSCRDTNNTGLVVSLVGVVLAYILLHLASNLAIVEWWQARRRGDSSQGTHESQANNGSGNKQGDEAATEKTRSLVFLLATLAVTITYQAGLDPPGGLWQDNGEGHKAGDPILLTTNARRYKAFFYCNSIAFVASLVVIILVRRRFLLKRHVLEAAMILDLFGLIGAYAAGSCRDVNTSIHAIAIAGAVLVYVVIHVVLFTLDHKHTSNKEEDDDEKLEKRRKRLLLFAVLAATIAYQAGLTPPGGFRLQDDVSGHHAGDPVLLYNYPRRYKVFFYCNSVSFMLSIALIILLMNPILYKPAIRSNALSVCTAAGLFSLMGAYAAGSTQHLKTSIYIFVLVAVVLVVVAILLLVFLQEESGQKNKTSTKIPGIKAEKDTHAKRKYLMLLGILVASVTYQAGLDPPGGVWQHNSDRHEAGNSIMHDNRRHRYLAFFYGNSTAFVASIVVILLLLPKSLQANRWWLRVMDATIVLDLFCLLGAYAAGSSRGWKTSVYVAALAIAVLAYIAIHVVLLSFIKKIRGDQAHSEHPPHRTTSVYVVGSRKTASNRYRVLMCFQYRYALQLCSCNVKGAAYSP